MSTVYQKYYTDESGQQYSVSVEYEKDANPRGYYLHIYPVEIEATEYAGIYSVCYTIDADFFQNRVRGLQIPVKRASKKAEAEAIERIEAPVNIYFYPRKVVHVGNMAESAAFAEQMKGA